MVSADAINEMLQATYERAVREATRIDPSLFAVQRTWNAQQSAALDAIGVVGVVDDDFRTLVRKIRADHGLGPMPGTYGAIERSEAPFFRAADPSSSAHVAHAKTLNDLRGFDDIVRRRVAKALGNEDA